MVLCLAGCRSLSNGAGNPVSRDVYRKWQQGKSYYAPVEIIDAHLANRPDYDRATKQDVFRHLGRPNWGTINQDPEKEWAYRGLGRHVPCGGKVILTFNKKNELISIGWVSEEEQH